MNVPEQIEKNLVRSVSCLNLNSQGRRQPDDLKEKQSNFKSQIQRNSSNDLKPVLKKGQPTNTMKPLIKTASSRSINSLPDRVAKSAIVKETKTPASDGKRPHTAFESARGKPNNKRLDLNDSEETISTDSESSSNSTAQKANLQKQYQANSSEAYSSSKIFTERRTGDAAEGKSGSGSSYSSSNTSGTSKDLSGSSNCGVLREQGPNYLVELSAGTLNIYGSGALNCIDLQWDKNAAQTATTARFQYVNFDEVMTIFPKLRVKFSKLQNFIFEETNLARCSQLNALAELHQVCASLTYFFSIRNYIIILLKYKIYTLW